VELQATGEEQTFSEKQLAQLLTLARGGLKTIFGLQKKALRR
jgi:ribonuclease PH